MLQFKLRNAGERSPRKLRLDVRIERLKMFLRGEVGALDKPSGKEKGAK